MTKEEYQKSVWNVACANLGYVVDNAYFYREEGVPDSVTDEQIIAECDRVLAAQQAALSAAPTPASPQALVDQIATLQSLIAALSGK
jgi:hypothetical protein